MQHSGRQPSFYSQYIQMDNLYWVTVLIVLFSDPTCVSPSTGTTNRWKSRLIKYCSVLILPVSFSGLGHSQKNMRLGRPSAQSDVATLTLLADRRLDIHKNFTKLMVLPFRK